MTRAISVSLWGLPWPADAWCVTYKFDKQTILPGSRLPEDGIVPFLLEAKPKKQIPIQLAAIPGKYYQA